jgi:hypothetical protein
MWEGILKKMGKSKHKLHKSKGKGIAWNNVVINLVPKKKNEGNRTGLSSKKIIEKDIVVKHAEKDSTDAVPYKEQQDINSSAQTESRADPRKRKRIAIIISSIVAEIVILSVVLPIAYVNRVRNSELRLESPVTEEGTAVLTWDAVDGADYYIISISGESPDEKKVYTNTYEPEGLLPGEYTASITAYNNNRKEIRTNAEALSFTIPKALLTVSIPLSAQVYKVYDKTTSYHTILTKNKDYIIAGTKYGNDVDITFESKVFNSSDVAACSSLRATFTTALSGEVSKYYYIEAGSIVISAHILPKEIAVTPESYGKQFGDGESLVAEAIDHDLGETISLTYIRQNGELVGDYDIIDAVTHNSNYTARVIDGAGKFSIAKRRLTLMPNEANFVEKTYNGLTGLTESEITAIEKDKHYLLGNLLNGYYVDINIVSASVNYDSVQDCTNAIIHFNGLAFDTHDIYFIDIDSIVLQARVLPKPINVLAPVFSKQFGDMDSLVSTYYDDALTTNLPLWFVREPGELLGDYDIIGIISLNENYLPLLIPNSGKDKFSIIKRIVTISPLNIEISKTYDGSDAFYSNIALGEHYEITNTLDGYNVDINVLNARFDSGDVAGGTKLIVEYAAVLFDEHDVYRTLSSRFEIPARILPKQVEIEPTKATKEYGDADELNYTHYDNETMQSIGFCYMRVNGEAIGLYDITGITNENTNYIFSVDNGNGKYEIVKRKIYVRAVVGSMISKVFDNSRAAIAFIDEDTHYVIENMLDWEPIGLLCEATYDTFSTLATTVTLSMRIEENEFSQHYEIIDDELLLPAQILPKEIEIIPGAIVKQYGDDDYLSGIYHDEILNINVPIVFTRTVGENVGRYSLNSVNTSNINYTLKFDLIRLVAKPHLRGVLIIHYSTN